FVRVLMTASSNTCDTHGRGDRRNCVGYAIDELGLGTLDSSLRFNDFVHHAPCGGEKPGRQPCGIRQTAIYASSTDPWHDATSRVRDQEQPGLDLIARSGLTRGRPATYPVSMLYSTPENAVAEVRYLRARGYPIAQIELGEEPDGQYAEPEDYGALYVRWARAIHAVAPGLPLGGPVFSGVNADLQTWPDAHGEVSWLKRFLAYLRAHGAMNELAFMSFEHYPFDGCEHGAKLQADLLREPALIAGMAHTWRADGLPRTIPMEVTEANFSAVNFTQTPMQIEGALWLADYLAGALTAGVDRAVYYQYEPVPLSRNAQCPTDWGNLTMFAADDTAHIRARTAQFYGARMLTHEWLEPGDRVHALFPAATNMLRGNAPLVSAYAARRPDGTWSVLLVNKDMRAHDVRVEFADAARPGEPPGFTGTVRRTTFGPQQYVWRSRGAQSSPSPNAPPLATSVSGGPPSALHAAGTLADRAAWHFRGRGVDAMIALVLAALSGALVTMHVDTNPAHRIATIRPVRALGSAIDSDPQGKIPFLYTPARTRVMLDAGLGELSYRLYTELSIQDWHWNPSGTFSDAAHGRGYWTSSASTARTPIVDSFGYRLPRRGSTRDQGDDDDFSRMDDGDPATFWKSDPYLTSAYTHDPDVQHAQWAVLDFDRPRDVDAIRIAWAQPYATRYVVQWWSGPDAILDQGHGAWHTFPNGTVVGRRGGTALRRLADAPVRARFVRVLMTASSGTCDADGPGDPRNCMGYAIREIGFGRFGADGRFEDLVVHSRCGGPPPPAKPRCGTRQTTIFVSSIDPWHE
ncbi:MAG: discoidin domain-containing protein, partial [Candidatus Eremiobacteraeota bacterium]|nr:discoidin domain-containing protein [Candidatus Eremiobacteraeota bacterium]